MRCPYCDGEPRLVNGDVIYPHRPDLRFMLFWLCAPCGAYVGCHLDSNRPLGRLADAELRAAKSEAHAAFDPTWRGGRRSRSAAYAWLASKLGLPGSKCHIGMFDVETCQRVVAVCEEEVFV